MKILHIWDCAGVASILAKYQRKQGHDVKVIMRKSSDTLRITEFYGNTVDLNGPEFIRYAVRLAKEYDIIHVHNLSKILPRLRLRYPRKKIIIHHHGFTSATQKRAKFCARFSNRVFLATDDLKSVFPKGTVIPTIIDTDHFNGKPVGEGSLSFTMPYLDVEKFRWKVSKDVQIIDREKTPIQYKDMPEFLKKFDTYYDIKFLYGKLLKAHSKTCFEALACGLQVVDWHGGTMYGLPEDHKPEHVTDFCLKNY